MADYYGAHQPMASSSRLTVADMSEGYVSSRRGSKDLLLSEAANDDNDFIASSRAVARARARSVGGDKRLGLQPYANGALPMSRSPSHISEGTEGDEHHYLPQSTKGYDGSLPMAPEYRNAAASPDYSLESQPVTWSIYDQLAHGPSRAPPAKRWDAEVSKSPRVDATTSNARPPFTSQIKSLFTSFAGGQQQGESWSSSESKARTSAELERRKHSSAAANWATRLHISDALAMPAARLAAPAGLTGLNDDSPPLTPSSSEAAEEGLSGPTASQPWNGATADRTSTWTPFSSTTFTSSERLSPILSLFSGTTAESITPPSRPSSSTSVQRKYGASGNDGLLPSHYSSPPTSPEPHSNQRQVQSSQQALATSWVEASTTLSSSLMSRFTSLSKRTQLPPVGPHVPALLFFLTAFIGSTTCVVLALSTLPLRLPSHITDLTLAEIRDMSVSLRNYSLSSHKAFAHTLAVLGAFFTWKQSFTVPGSLIMNVVFGAMYGTFFGTIYTSLLTAVGGICCYLLVAPLAPIVSAMPGLKIALDKMRRALQDGMDNEPSMPSLTRRGGSIARRPVRRQSKMEKSNNSKGKDNNIWSYLLVLRLLPIVPYGLMNIACSVLRVPLLPYGVTLALGSIPWNACTVQIGDLLNEVASALDDVPAEVNHVGVAGFVNAPNPLMSPSAVKAVGKAAFGKGHPQSALQAISAKVWNREMIFRLVFMSVISLAPMLIQRWLKARRAAEEPDGQYDGETYDSEDDLSVAAESEHLLRRSTGRYPSNSHEVDAIEMASSSSRDLEGASYSNEGDVGPASAHPSRPKHAAHTRTNSLRHSLAGLGAGRQPRYKRAIAKAFM